MKRLEICTPLYAVSACSDIARQAAYGCPNVDKEIEIVYELSQNVLKYEEMLNTASDICGELDRWIP